MSLYFQKGRNSFVSSILAGQTVAPSFYDGWQAQRLIDGALVSDERGAGLRYAEIAVFGPTGI
ncbi:MAG: hypothetical protein KJZ86_01220 [Caldilineaceae bacterium]|nr:hypothetical protein [Caldilineaceae bacterium]HRJ45526.1 hypothetical protein [Caldilineaceae bacterium]